MSTAIPRAPSGVGIFCWVRWKMWRAGFRDLLQSPVKLLVILSMWAILMIGLYEIGYQGIRFVFTAAGLGPFLMSRVWFLLLFILMILLAASQLTGAYSTIVHAPETRWWMSLPVSARTLMRVKWMESSFYSAWAMAVLLLPMSLAYFTVLQRPWWLVIPMTVVAVLPLLGIVTALSTMALLIWLRWFGRIVVRREVMTVGFVCACGALFWVLGERRGDQDVWFLALQDLLPRMQVAMSMWLPSSWVATVLDAALNERWREAALYLALLWTTAGVAWRLLDHLAASLLLPTLRQQMPAMEAPIPRAAASAGASTGLIARWWMRSPFHASLVKDVLLVLRDPAQWSQAVVFFGLLGAYFANIHRVTLIRVEPSWRLAIASLNLACTLLVFGSLAVRFIFPQMSLEGRTLWLLRTSPHGMRQLLTAKVVLYGVLAVVIVEGLLVLSSGRLDIPPLMRGWLALEGALAAVTLVSLTVGLGAWWMDPDAQDAARIVSSSNGALVLVFVLCYVGVVVAGLVVAWKSWLNGSYVHLTGASVCLGAISVLANIIPIQGGLRRLERFESALLA